MIKHIWFGMLDRITKEHNILLCVIDHKNINLSLCEIMTYKELS